jgi:hypothetical protein
MGLAPEQARASLMVVAAHTVCPRRLRQADHHAGSCFVVFDDEEPEAPTALPRMKARPDLLVSRRVPAAIP